jgi:hypothetical protein
VPVINASQSKGVSFERSQGELSTPIRHFVTASLAHEHDGPPGSRCSLAIAAARDPDGRVALQLGYPARAGSHTLLLERRQSAD